MIRGAFSLRPASSSAGFRKNVLFFLFLLWQKRENKEEKRRFCVINWIIDEKLRVKVLAESFDS